MSISDKIQYDTMIPFFGIKNDQRARLFLDYLDRRASSTTGSASSFSTPSTSAKVDNKIKHQFYNNPNLNSKLPAGSSFLQADKVDFEFASYILDVATRLGSKDTSTFANAPGLNRVVSNNVNASEILDIIHKLGNTTQSNKLTEFFQSVVQLLLSNLTDGVSSILNQPSKWAFATEFTFHPINQIINVTAIDADLINAINTIITAITARGSGAYDNALQISLKQKAFTFELTKKLQFDYLEEAMSNTYVPVGSSKFLASFDEPSHANKYFRDLKDTSKLFMRDDNGNVVEVSAGSKHFFDNTNDKCVGTKVVDGANDESGNPLTCTNYLLECIGGKDSSQCKEYMKSKDFWGSDKNSIKKEIDLMVPAVARKTLEAFEFKTANVYDNTAERNLIKVESVNDWATRLSKEASAKGLSDDEVKNIVGNNNLIDYLTLIVEKVNSNPSILNENYLGMSDDSLPYSTDRFRGQYLYQLNILPKKKFNNYRADSVLRTNDTVKYAIADLRAVVAPKLVVVGGIQTGGAENDIEMIGGGDVSLETVKLRHAVLEQQFKTIKDVLESHNKKLDPSNEQELLQALASFKKTENKLMSSIKLINEYIKLLNVYKYNDPHKVLTLDKLDEIMKANSTYTDKLDKKQNNLIEALNTLNGIVNNAVNQMAPATNVATGSLGFSHKN